MNQTLLPEPTLLPAPDSPQPATAPDPSVGRLPKRRRRTGKIATLPHALREQINLLLQDGLPYRAIIEKLQAPGAPPLLYPISEHHLSEWKDGGHQDWLKDQFWKEELRRRSDLFTGLAGADPIQLPEAGLQVAALSICEMLRDLADPDNDAQPEPDQHVRPANSLARLSRSILQLQQYRDTAAKAKAAELKRHDPNRKLNDIELNACLDQVDDLFGLKSADRLRKEAADRSLNSEATLPTDGTVPAQAHATAESQQLPNPHVQPTEVQPESGKGEGPAQTAVPSPLSSGAPAAPVVERCLECNNCLPPLLPSGRRPSRYCSVCRAPLPPPGSCREPSVEQCPLCRANLPRVLPDGRRPLHLLSQLRNLAAGPSPLASTGA